MLPVKMGKFASPVSGALVLAVRRDHGCGDSEGAVAKADSLNQREVYEIQSELIYYLMYLKIINRKCFYNLFIKH